MNKLMLMLIMLVVLGVNTTTFGFPLSPASPFTKNSLDDGEYHILASRNNFDTDSFKTICEKYYITLESFELLKTNENPTFEKVYWYKIKIKSTYLNTSSDYFKARLENLKNEDALKDWNDFDTRLN